MVILTSLSTGNEVTCVKHRCSAWHLVDTHFPSFPLASYKGLVVCCPNWNYRTPFPRWGKHYGAAFLAGSSPDWSGDASDSIASPGVTPLPGGACTQWQADAKIWGPSSLAPTQDHSEGSSELQVPLPPPCSWLRLLWLQHSPDPPSAQTWALPTSLFILILRTHPHKATAHPSLSIGFLMNLTHASPLLGSAFKPWLGLAPSVWSHILPSQNHLSSTQDVIFNCSWVLTVPLHLPPLALLMRSSPSFEAHFSWCIF